MPHEIRQRRHYVTFPVEMGRELSLRAEDISGSKRKRMHFLEWEQGNLSADLIPPLIPHSTGHLLPRELNKVHKYFTFMT